jgi:glycogen debranching enzyme
MNTEAAQWKVKADSLLKKLFGLCWKEDRFVALRSHTHDYRPDPSSLQTHIPVVLGEYLGKDKMDIEAGVLKNRFLTEYGLATEAPDSPRYESDGYWRGPIWAPSTYLIVDGLRRGGYPELAEDIARRYINLSANVARGNYENFNALTGKGFRAPGYTWSASVYMVLKWEYPL